MVLRFITLISFTILLLLLGGCRENEIKKLGTETMGEFAPPDAYLEGEKHPYYGSENAWDQRFFYEHDKEYYKRRGQRAMLEIMKKNYSAAEEYCRDLLAKDPTDLEAMFNLSAVLALQNRIDDAMTVVKKSVELGLPFGRYLAGPREILKPLVDSKPFKDIAAQFDIKILHGPMLGRVSSNGASFWVRTANEYEVQIEISENEKMKDAILSEPVNSKSENDYTAILRIDNLQEDHRYYYKVLVEGKFDKSTGIKTFKTYPTAGVSSEFRIAFGGGAGYVPPNERIWDVIRQKDLSAFLFMGDNVYINMPEQPNAVHYYTYYRRQSRPEFKDLISSTPSYAIWDDHDAATDDVWLGPYKDKPSWKMPLLKVFEQNWVNPFYGSEEWPACYFNFEIGDVEIFMLDGRIYRTNPFADNPTMLGPAQKEWLLASVKKSKATFKIIASPVPWSYESKKDAKDTWNGFHDEREEIFNFLTDNKINGVFLLSADRHRSDAWEIKRDNDYSLYEFTSSRLTNQHSHPLENSALFGYNEKQSFGLLTFNTKLDDPTVTFDIYSIDNEKINSFTLKKSQLSYKD